MPGRTGVKSRVVVQLGVLRFGGLGAKFKGGFGHLRRGVWDEGEAGSVEDVEAEVAASFGPFVGLLGEDRADETGDHVAVGEVPDTVGEAADLTVEALVRAVGQICCQNPSGKLANARMSAQAASRC